MQQLFVFNTREKRTETGKVDLNLPTAALPHPAQTVLEDKVWPLTQPQLGACL